MAALVVAGISTLSLAVVEVKSGGAVLCIGVLKMRSKS
jgi:hypothetical protein